MTPGSRNLEPGLNRKPVRPPPLPSPRVSSGGAVVLVKAPNSALARLLRLARNFHRLDITRRHHIPWKHSTRQPFLLPNFAQHPAASSPLSFSVAWSYGSLYTAFQASVLALVVCVCLCVWGLSFSTTPSSSPVFGDQKVDL